MSWTFSVEPQSVSSKTEPTETSSKTANQYLYELGEAIARYEGFYKDGSLAQRNNNPGNLRYVSWSTRKSGLDSSNFAIYPTAEDGLYDLYDLLMAKAEAGYTLEELMNIYAPPVENNTNAYVAFVADELGVSPNTKLSTILY